MSETFKRSAALLIAVILIFGVLYHVMITRPELPVVDQQVGISSGSVMVEAITMASALTYTTGYGQQYGFVTTTNAIYGELLDIYIDYTASISTTTDITVSCLGLLTENLLISPNTATDAVWRPRVLPVFYDTTLITPSNQSEMYNLQGKIVVNIAETSGTAPGTIYIRYRR